MLADELFKNARVDDLYMSYPVLQQTVLQGINVCELQLQDERYLSGKTYNLHATIGVKFKAQPGAYGPALQQAKRTLLHRIYAPLLGQLQEIKSAAQSGDAHDVMRICNRLQKDLLEGTD